MRVCVCVCVCVCLCVCMYRNKLEITCLSGLVALYCQTTALVPRSLAFDWLLWVLICIIINVCVCVSVCVCAYLHIPAYTRIDFASNHVTY